MLPTFVIGLREGVEASLIVGIVAAFLSQQGNRNALRAMWAGVALAVALCVGVALVLEAVNQDLPQRQQERLETVVAFAAVGMVTFMIVWMRRHAANLAGELQQTAAHALASGSMWALVGMAFFAVLREGLETAVFLLAAFQASSDPASAGLGATLGVVVAVIIGYGIYRGGIKLNLARFFKFTSAVLVLVAAGLVASALHTAHEGAWLTSGQAQAIDLSWLVVPGTVSSSLLTGILGLQPQPVVAEVVGWLLYAVPMLTFVLWPRRTSLSRSAGRAIKGGVAATLLVALALGLAACGDDDTSASSGGDARTIKLTLSDQGCAPSEKSIPAGAVTFVVENSGSAKVTEGEILDAKGVIIGERENIAPGLSADFSLNMKAGDYTVQCPNADTERFAFKVTGAGGTETDPKLATATAIWKQFVDENAAELLKRTKAFTAAVKAGDVAKARDQFATTRLYYERIEPVAESFGDLDPSIDARVNDVASGDTWTGFHRIERALFVKNSTAGMAKYADKLLADVTKLHDEIPELGYQAPQLANGAVELLNEVAKSKITGEEDRYSHTDLSDFQGNLDGAKTAFEALKPVLVDRKKQKLATTISARFAAVEKTLATYRRSDEPSGWASYKELTKADRRTLTQAIDALAEPLSTVASQVST
ncbi:MAG TPA: iron uptake system protein EfeO [Solirubrobacteraceae bacterium]|nr:iron uptake system protein EfeO [Solirubrobacteraceae bacterium]